MESVLVGDDYPKDFSEELLLVSIKQVKQKVWWMQDVLGFNASVKRKLSKQVDLRNLAIDCHYYDLAYHHYGTCPKIRLNGKWLEKWGFKIGGRVNIITLPGLLILSPDQVIKPVPQTYG
jgi:hypothetical protein